MTIKIPESAPGRRSAEADKIYRDEVAEFCKAIKEIKSRLDFSVSSRGWCYVLEEYGLSKGDFDKAQLLINDCRKNGLLPLDICATDEARTADGLEDIDNEAPEEYARDMVDYIKNSLAYQYYPFSFTLYQECYLEILVEKIDLKGIFAPVCNKYHIPFSNSRGWADINGRAELLKRFRYWSNQGKRCVLLYCGDHDPGGLSISDSIRKNLSDVSEAVGWEPSDLIIERFGLNYDFIEANNLTWIENLITGSGKDLADPANKENRKSYVQNYITQFGARKVEANALVTRIEAGRRLCEETILKYIDPAGIDEHYRHLATARGRVKDEIKRLLTEV